MPADDLVLNVRQVAQYPSAGSAPPSASLLMQLGIGGPYYSISPQALVSTALALGGGMAIGGELSAQSFAGGPAQFTSAAIGMLTAQRACIVDFAANRGTIGGAPIASTLDVAATVTSFNARTGPITLWLEDILCAGGAPLYSPRFLGNPRAATPCPESNSTRLATTAYVTAAIAALVAGEGLVSSFNGRTGAIVLTADDITAADPPYAPLDSPNFSGYATAPTAASGTNDGQIATTAFVMNAVQDSTTGVASFNGRTGIVVLAGADISAAGGALLASPPFTGTPTAPTAAPGTNTTQLATTAFVMAATQSGYAPLNSPAFTGVPTAPTAAVGTNTAQLATTAYVLAAITAIDAGVLSFNGRTGAVSLLANDISAAGGALLASPAFTGTPTAPTASVGTNSTQLATTAFVMAQIAAGGGVQSFNGRAGAVTLTAADVSAAGGPYLPTAGGTVTGLLTVGPFSTGVSTFVLTKAAGTNQNAINATAAGLSRWQLILGNSTAESGSNVGSDFGINRASDAGTVIDTPLAIIRSSGQINNANGIMTWAHGGSTSLVNQTGMSYFTGNGLIIESATQLISLNRTSAGPLQNFYNTPSTVVGSISSTGTSVAYNTTSDSRLKTDPRAFDAGPIIDALEVWDFAWLRDNSRSHGVIAQDAAEIFPEAVTHDEKNDSWGVDYSKYVSLLLNEMKALRARVAILEAAA
jgi:Chaperone of endosialidase